MKKKQHPKQKKKSIKKVKFKAKKVSKRNSKFFQFLENHKYKFGILISIVILIEASLLGAKYQRTYTDAHIALKDNIDIFSDFDYIEGLSYWTEGTVEIDGTQNKFWINSELDMDEKVVNHDSTQSITQYEHELFTTDLNEGLLNIFSDKDFWNKISNEKEYDFEIVEKEDDKKRWEYKIDKRLSKIIYIDLIQNYVRNNPKCIPIDDNWIINKINRSYEGDPVKLHIYIQKDWKKLREIKLEAKGQTNLEIVINNDKEETKTINISFENLSVETRLGNMKFSDELDQRDSMLIKILKKLSGK